MVRTPRTACLHRLPKLLFLGALALLAALLALPGAAAQVANATAEAPSEPPLVFDRYENPLPAPFDGPLGIFLLDAAIWALIGAGVMFIVAPTLKWIAIRTPTDIDRHIVGIVSKPGFFLVFTYGIVDSVRVFAVHPTALWWLDRLWDSALIFVLTIVIYRIWKEVILSVGKSVAAKTESDLDDKLYPLFAKLGGIVIVLAGLFFIVESYGVNMAFFAAGGAVVSLVVAFAAQDTLANFFAGIHILLDRPFREGDRIEIQEIGTWGDVTDIGLRTTRVRTRDNRMVIVPNSVIGSNPIVNHSFPDTTYRLQVEVGVAYGTDIEEARRVLVESAQSAEGVDPQQPVEALFLQFADSALVFRVRWWIPNYVDTRRSEDKVNTAIEKGLKRAGIEIPFPQRTVWFANADGQPT